MRVGSLGKPEAYVISKPVYVIPRPKGGVLEKNTVTTTSSWQTLVEHLVADGLKLQLSKILVSVIYGSYVRFSWAGSVISATRLIDDKSVLIEHFPYDYYEMVGDGVKKFTIEVKYYTTAGEAYGEIVGEEA